MTELCARCGHPKAMNPDSPKAKLGGGHEPFRVGAGGHGRTNHGFYCGCAAFVPPERKEEL